MSWFILLSLCASILILTFKIRSLEAKMETKHERQLLLLDQLAMDVRRETNVRIEQFERKFSDDGK